MENSLDRWISLLRMKARDCGYEDGKDKIYPSIHQICNEMEAFKDAVKMIRGDL